MITTIAQSDVWLCTKNALSCCFWRSVSVSRLAAAQTAARRVLTVSAQVFKRGLNLQLVTERQRHSEGEDFLLQPALSHLPFNCVSFNQLLHV